MNYQDFFKEVEGHSIDRIDFTIEELYQFFKARLFDDTVVLVSPMGLSGKLVDK